MSADNQMLTEVEIRTSARSRAKVLIPTMVLSLTSASAFVFFVASSLPARTSDGLRFLVFTGWFVLFLIPVGVAIRFTDRYSTICPACNKNLDAKYPQVIATRCCNECGERIVTGGRKRDVAVYRRMKRIEMRRFLVWWFWSWPVLGIGTLVFIREQPWLSLMIALLGAGTGGYTLARTWDHRYMLQTIASAILFAVAITLLN